MKNLTAMKTLGLNFFIGFGIILPSNPVTMRMSEQVKSMISMEHGSCTNGSMGLALIPLIMVKH